MQRALERWMDEERHAMPDLRVALTLGQLFDPAEKAPLPPNAASITGTLPALTSLGMEPALREPTSTLKFETHEGEERGTRGRRGSLSPPVAVVVLLLVVALALALVLTTSGVLP